MNQSSSNILLATICWRCAIQCDVVLCFKVILCSVWSLYCLGNSFLQQSSLMHMEFGSSYPHGQCFMWDRTNFWKVRSSGCSIYELISFYKCSGSSIFCLSYLFRKIMQSALYRPFFGSLRHLHVGQSFQISHYQ